MSGAVVEKVLRTPEERFRELKGFPYEPKYFSTHLFCNESISIRMAYYDEGPRDSDEVILLTHGEPSWSYLNRKLAADLAKTYRVVMPDLVGFGRSDKPVEDLDYSYHRHIAWLGDLLFNHLGLEGITAVFQDWGGLLGLRLAAQQPARFRRMVVANTFLPTCDESFFKVADGFFRWKKGAPKLMSEAKVPFGSFMKAGTGGPGFELDSEEERGYAAPFPSDEYRAGARRFPELVPTPPSDPTGRPQPLEGENNAAAWRVFEAWQKPTLLAFSDLDDVMKGADQIWLERCPGTKGQDHVIIQGCSHFLQDGGAPQLVSALRAFIQANPVPVLAKL